jgi:hypothetical protein
MEGASKPAHEVGRLIRSGRLDFQAELAAAKVNIRIILITGHADVSMTVQAMRGGAIEFLIKPLQRDVLVAVRFDRIAEMGTGDQDPRYGSRRSAAPAGHRALVNWLDEQAGRCTNNISEVTVKFHYHNVRQKLGELPTAWALPAAGRRFRVINQTKVHSAIFLSSSHCDWQQVLLRFGGICLL